MSAAVADLLAAALKLSVDDQRELAEGLLEHLEPPESDIDRMTDAEFEAELSRRREESLRDPSVMIPWEKVRRELVEEFGDAGRRPPAGQAGDPPGGGVPPATKPRSGRPVRDRG